MTGSDQKPKLTAEQKKQRHAAEQRKYLDAVRRGLYELSELVPGMQGQSRHEGMLLQAAVKELNKLLAEKERLRGMAHKRGMTDEDFEKAYQGAKQASQEAEEAEGEANEAEGEIEEDAEGALER